MGIVFPVKQFLFLVFLATGCGYKETHELKIDKDLPVLYQEAVIEAAAKWEAHGFDLPVSIVDRGANVRQGYCSKRTSCAARYYEIHFTNLDRTDKSEVTFMALHEVGHFLGIRKHLADGNVMQSGWTLPLPTMPTEADVRLAWDAQ